MTSPVRPFAGANDHRTDTVRGRIAAVVQRLTMKLLDPGAGVSSKDRYVYTIRKAIGKGDALPVQMILAVAYDDIQKGRSVADVTAWAREFIEEVEAWAAERDGAKILPPDITPALRLENREESHENDAALGLSADPTSIAAHERYIVEAEEEVAAQEGVIAMVRRRLTVLRRGMVTA